MANRIRAHDWSATPLGPIEGWPPSLRVATRLMLNTRHPIFIWWGPELIQLYNDAYRDTMGPEKHPSAIGGRGQDTWAEIWDVIGPQIAQVMAGGAATWHEDQLVPVTRHGNRKQVWWTYSFSPIDHEASPNGVGGVLVICRDVTEEHLAHARLREGEARQRFLLDLSDALRPLSDERAIASEASRALGEHLGADRAFLTEVDPDGITLRVRDEHLRSGASSVLGQYRFDQFGAFVGRDLHGGRILAVEDVSALAGLTAGERATYAATGIAAYLLVPLMREGRLTAYYTINHRTPRRWSEGERALARQVADRTWAAMEHARAGTALRESEERQAYLLALSDALRPLADPAVIQHEAMRLLGERLGVSRAQYYTADETGEYLSSSGGYTDGVPAAVGRFRLIDFGEYAYAGFHAGQTQVVSDATTDPRIDEAVLASYKAVGFLAYVGVPFIQRGRLVGTVAVHQAGPRPWTASERMIVEGTAERAGIAVEQTRAELALRESEEQQRLTLQLVPAMLWSADPAGHFVYADQHWKSVTGQQDVEINDFGWVDAIHPDDREATRAAFEHAFATGEPIERQQRIHQAADGYRWHLVRHVPVRDAGGAILRWFGAAIDVHELRELQDRQEVLVAELQHRTRNLMGVVQAMFEDTLQSTGDLDLFTADYRDRLRALGRVQGLLSRLSNSDRITFDALIRDEIRAIGAPPEGGKVTLDGPAGVALRSSTVQTFALAIHELATNALKYGALRQPAGKLTVAWRLAPAGPDQKPWLHVDWTESGVAMPPAGSTPKDTGQGRKLIEQALPYQLGAITTYVMASDGVRCSIAVPVSSRTAAGETEDDRATAP